MRFRARQTAATFLILSTALSTACGSGLLVELSQGEDYTFPPKKILRGAIAARATGDVVSGLIGSIATIVPDVVTTNAEGWVCASLDVLVESGAISFPFSLGPLEANVGGRNLAACFDLAAVAIELVPGTDPAEIRLTGDDVELALENPAVLFGDAALLGADVSAACVVDNDLVTGTGTPYLVSVDFVATATLLVAPSGALDISVSVDSLNIEALGVSIVQDCGQPECQDENPGDDCIECTICDLANFGADLFVFIEDAVGELIGPVLTDVFNLLTPTLLDGVLNGRPLNIVAEIGLGNVLGAFTAAGRTATPLGLLVRPAPDGFAVSSVAGVPALDLRLEGGTAVDELHPCAEGLGSEPTFSPGPYPEFGDAAPGGGDYDLAVGVSEAFINQLLWSLRATGALCLELDTGELASLLTGADLAAGFDPGLLDAGFIDVLVPGLARLTGPNATLRVVIDPRFTSADLPVARVAAPASEALGAITVRLPQVVLGIDVFLAGRFVRLTTLDASLRAGLDVVVAGSLIEIGIGAVSIESATVQGGGLAAGAQLDQVVALGMDVVATVLERAGSFAFSFDVSSLTAFFGDTPFLPTVVAIEPTGPAGDWLGVWLALEPAELGGPL